MKLWIVGLVLVVVVAFAIAVPFPQHLPTSQTNKRNPNLFDSVAEYAQRKKMEDRERHNGWPSHETGLSGQKAEWFRKMNSPNVNSGLAIQDPNFWQFNSKSNTNNGRPRQHEHKDHQKAQLRRPMQGRNKAQQWSKGRQGNKDKDCECNPVDFFECGVDGKTYQNSCFRICAAVTFKKPGKC